MVLAKTLKQGGNVLILDEPTNLEKRAEELAAIQLKPARPTASVSPAAPVANRSRKLKWKEERELESIEAVILEAEDKVTNLEKRLRIQSFIKRTAKTMRRWKRT